MNLRLPAIVCIARSHGETGLIARILTEDHGLLAGYVRGGRSRRMRPVLMPGNVVAAELRGRVDTQLAALTVELVESRATLLDEPLSAAVVEWVTVLIASALPEAHPYPRLYRGLTGMLDALALSNGPRDWIGGLVRFERSIIAELGFGGGEDGATRVFEALEEHRHVLAAELLTGRAAQVLDARERLVARLRRALLPG